ncbi:MAG TPA: cyclodeaminase/cyclohydrolase family protein [Blastocatellia bacterium]|nr:cyclodeaminase/cyclohydrolase family protein [Blastocatellia bacterium]
MSQSSQADSKPNLSLSIGKFAELVAEATPTPGGGSVSAYSGVLAASLGQMVCSITIGKPKYAMVEPRLREISSKLAQTDARLRELIAEDAESFDGVLQAYRMPKETDDQKGQRAIAIQKALQSAIAVPFETAERSLDVLRLLGELAEIGTPNALSDVAVGAQLALVAVKGASYNVGANLGSITDRESAKQTRGNIDIIIEQAGTIAGKVDERMKAQG